eukprot:6161173-Pyramimonas_sp.AAC.1
MTVAITARWMRASPLCLGCGSKAMLGPWVENLTAVPGLWVSALAAVSGLWVKRRVRDPSVLRPPTALPRGSSRGRTGGDSLGRKEQGGAGGGGRGLSLIHI